MVSQEAYTGRLTKLREAMQTQDVDCFVFTNREEEKPDIWYLTGFTGSSGTCVVTQDRQIFVTDGRYKDQATREVYGWDVEIRKTGSSTMFLSELLNGLQVKRVGLTEGREMWYIPRGLSRHATSYEVVPLSDVLSDIRAIKEEQEIAAIRNTVVALEGLLEKTYGHIRPGVFDDHLASRFLRMVYNKRGKVDYDFIILVSGAHSAYPHGNPFELPKKRMKVGDIVQFDTWCTIRRYTADISRVAIIGKATDEHRRMHQALQEAIGEALKLYRPGVPTRQAALRADEVLVSYGYDPVTHGIGHGIGLNVHEKPAISSVKECIDVFQVGHVVAIEPAIYREGYGGMRIERDVVIRPDGNELLDKTLTTDLLEVGHSQIR